MTPPQSKKPLMNNVDRGAYIYLPNGVYRISDTLRWGGDEGTTAQHHVLQGQSRDGTILLLRDHCPGFAQSAQTERLHIHRSRARAAFFQREFTISR